MGWWKLEAWREDDKELTNIDREHIAKLIKEGYDQGEVCEE